MKMEKHTTGRQWQISQSLCSQMSLMVLSCKQDPHLWTPGPYITLMESVPDHLSRHMYICGLLEVILPFTLSSGSFS